MADWEWYIRVVPGWGGEEGREPRYGWRAVQVTYRDGLEIEGQISFGMTDTAWLTPEDARAGALEQDFDALAAQNGVGVKGQLSANGIDDAHADLVQGLDALVRIADSTKPVAADPVELPVKKG